MSKKRKNSNKYLLLFILLFFVFLLLAWICSKQDHKLILENGVEIDYDTQPMLGTTEGIEIPGLNTQYILTNQNPSLRLFNPTNNTVYFKYTVYLKDMEIHKTDWLTPDRMTAIDLWSLLEEGEYHVTIHIDTMDILSEKLATTADLKTKIIVQK